MQLPLACVLAEYASGKLVPSVAVGEEIQVSKSGTYEMYILFSLEPQLKALDLIKNYLWMTGLVLLILITFSMFGLANRMKNLQYLDWMVTDGFRFRPNLKMVKSVLNPIVWVSL